MSLQLSVSEILNSVEGLEMTKFDQLYRELYALRLQRNSGVNAQINGDIWANTCTNYFRTSQYFDQKTRFLKLF